MSAESLIEGLPPAAWLPTAAALRAMADQLERMAQMHRLRQADRRRQRAALDSAWLAGGRPPETDHKSPEVRLAAKRRLALRAKVQRNRRIVELAKAGLSNEQIGRKVGLSDDQVARVLRAWLRVAQDGGGAR